MSHDITKKNQILVMSHKPVKTVPFLGNFNNCKSLHFITLVYDGNNYQMTCFQNREEKDDFIKDAL